MSDVMSVEEFNKLCGGLSDDVDRKRLAKVLGVELPIDPVSSQLKEKVKLVQHTPKATKRNPEPAESTYVSVPSLKIDANSGTKAFWVKASVVREVAQRLIEVADENEL